MRFSVSAAFNGAVRGDFSCISIDATNADAAANQLIARVANDPHVIDTEGYEKNFIVSVYHTGKFMGTYAGKTLRRLNARILAFTDDLKHTDFVNILHDLHEYNPRLIAALKQYRKKNGYEVLSSD